MKHLYKLSLLLLALLLPATAIAHDFEVDGIYYNINGNEATVTYKGTYSHQNTDRYSGFVTIPAAVTYNGATYSVTSIGEWAFDNCTGLTNIYIPNSVTSIGKGAFYLCSGLTSVTIPDSVTSIGEGAFWGCTSLTNITIPNSVTSIGDGAFADCSGLASIDIPNSVTTIGDNAFDCCWNLTSVTIGNSVTSIGDNAFSQCTSLTSITIPNSVISIGRGAFSNCSDLTSVIIGNSVSSIGDGAFGGCTSLTSIVVASGNPKYDSRDNCNAIIETASNTLLFGCQNTIIPNSVTTIGNSAFSYCGGLTSVTIPNSVTSIGNQAFSYCSGLTSIVVSSGNPTYDSRNNCNAIIETASNMLITGCQNTTIPNSVTSIGNSAFSYCSGLTSITIPNSVTSIGNWAFNGCNNLVEIYSLALIPPAIDSYTFNGCYGATLYVPKEAVNAYRTANYWKKFTNIVGYVACVGVFEVDGILYRAMNDGTATVIANEEMENYYIGDKVIADTVTFEGNNYVVKIIEDNAFSDCYDLTSVTIPNSVETIGEQAFQGCTGLTSVTIGSGVTAIGAKAFNYCNALETVKCLGTVPPVMASADCFSTAAYNRATLLVPRQFVDAYQAADYWYKFAHIDGWGSVGRGDIDGDGAVSIRDVTTLIDAILNGNNEGIYVESADLNSNGRLDIGDVTTIIDMLLNDIE